GAQGARHRAPRAGPRHRQCARGPGAVEPRQDCGVRGISNFWPIANVYNVPPRTKALILGFGKEDLMKQDRFPVTRTDAEWRKILTPEQYDVMRGHGTERPGSCALLYEKRPGTFVCAGCGQHLFESATKFESGTGWPSFTIPVEGSIETSEDHS